MKGNCSVLSQLHASRCPEIRTASGNGCRSHKADAYHQSHISEAQYAQDLRRMQNQCTLRINSTHAKYIGMNCSTAKDFNPAGSFTETAAFSAAFEAGNINLCTWLCKREVMWSEFCFGFWSEKFFCKYFKSSFQVCERNIFIYYKASI